MEQFVVTQKKGLTSFIIFLLCIALLILALFLINIFFPVFGKDYDGFQIFNLKGVILIFVIIILAFATIFFAIYSVIKMIFSKDSTFVIVNAEGIYYKKFNLLVPWRNISATQKNGNLIFIQIKNSDEILNSLSLVNQRIVKYNSDFFDKQMSGFKVIVAIKPILHSASASELFSKIEFFNNMNK